MSKKLVIFLFLPFLLGYLLGFLSSFILMKNKEDRIEVIHPASKVKKAKKDEDKKKELLETALKNIEEGKLNLAEDKLKKVIELDPQDKEAYFILGKMYDILGEDEAAVKAYVKSLMIEKKRR